MGNPINYNGVSLTWQGKQLKSHTTTNGYMTTALYFAYDENGLRTEKGFVGNKTYYYYNGSVLIGMQKGNVTQRFSYDASGKVVSVNYNGTDYYYLRNAQGDIVKLIDNNKNTVVEYTYDSWGKILSTTGSKAATLGTDQPFRYRGYVYDNETGWYYLQSRYYDPTTCRFISSDVYLSTGQGVIGHNSYAYCGNNPIARSDKLGFAWYSDVWNWIVGAKDDVVEWVTGAKDDAVTWITGAVADVSTFAVNTIENVSNAASKAWNWTRGAALDAGNWMKQAYDDANDWANQAALDAWSWTKKAGSDAWSWTKKAASDAWSWISGDRRAACVVEMAASTYELSSGIIQLANIKQAKKLGQHVGRGAVYSAYGAMAIGAITLFSNMFNLIR